MNGITNRVFAFIYAQLVKQQFLQGHRSVIAGATSILGAVVIIGDMLVNGQYDETKMAMAWAGLVLGYKILGDNGKQEQMIDAAKTTATATSATALTVAAPADIRQASAAVQNSNDTVQNGEKS